MHTWPINISIHQAHFCTTFGKCNSEVAGNCTFSHTTFTTHYRNNIFYTLQNTFCVILAIGCGICVKFTVTSASLFTKILTGINTGILNQFFSGHAGVVRTTVNETLLPSITNIFYHLSVTGLYPGPVPVHYSMPSKYLPLSSFNYLLK